MTSGEKIIKTPGGLKVPDEPIIPFIEGDGSGPDIWRASQRVLEAAVERAYGRSRRIVWLEALAGEKAYAKTSQWLPEETIKLFKEYLVGLKGPLTTPVGGGIRSLNVALRQELDLFACLRPVRYLAGVPSPVKKPELVNMVIFRENSEDIYLGIEWPAGSPEAGELTNFLQKKLGVKKIPFPKTSGLGIKPISEEGSKRLVRAAINYALGNKRRSVTLVHKGNIMKFTEGAFRDWGYEVAREEFPQETVILNEVEDQSLIKNKLVIKDVIADAFFQQILTRPEEYDVIATTNLNGDYLSDALAAEVGGIGLAPGANINFETGRAIFEATHGTAPKYAGQDKVNPSSLILSGAMMLGYLGWSEAEKIIWSSLEKTIGQGMVTYDLARLMPSAQEVKCSEFASALIRNI